MLFVTLKLGAELEIGKVWWKGTPFRPFTLENKYIFVGNGERLERVTAESMGELPTRSFENWEWLEVVFDNFQPAGLYQRDGTKVFVRNGMDDSGLPHQILGVTAKDLESLKAVYKRVRTTRLEMAC